MGKEKRRMVVAIRGARARRQSLRRVHEGAGKDSIELFKNHYDEKSIITSYSL